MVVPAGQLPDLSASPPSGNILKKNEKIFYKHNPTSLTWYDVFFQRLSRLSSGSVSGLYKPLSPAQMNWPNWGEHYRERTLYCREFWGTKISSFSMQRGLYIPSSRTVLNWPSETPSSTRLETERFCNDGNTSTSIENQTCGWRVRPLNRLSV